MRWFLPILLALVLPALAVAQVNDTGNATTSTTTLPPVPIVPACWVIADVVNVEWKPSWTEESLLGKCSFEPIVTNNLNTSGYRMTCDWDWNISKDQASIELFQQLMQLNKIDEMTKLSEENGRLKAKAFSLTIIIILLIVAALIYAGYDWFYSRSLRTNMVSSDVV